MFTEEEFVKSQIQTYIIDGANILKQRLNWLCKYNIC